METKQEIEDVVIEQFMDTTSHLVERGVQEGHDNSIRIKKLYERYKKNPSNKNGGRLVKAISNWEMDSSGVSELSESDAVGLAKLFEEKKSFQITGLTSGVMTTIMSESEKVIGETLAVMERSIIEEGKICPDDNDYYEIPAKIFVHKKINRMVILTKNNFEVVITDLEGSNSGNAKSFSINEVVKGEK